MVRLAAALPGVAPEARGGLWVSATPVTRAQYRLFLEDSGRAPAAGGTLEPGGLAQTGISAADAAAYAAWRGQRLPSTAELLALTVGLPQRGTEWRDAGTVGCLAPTQDGRFWTADLPLWTQDGRVVRAAATDTDTADAVGFVTVSDHL
jgi:formylglycine-generating enzyme required for sulfatase activity